jgi:hypothetical protein
VALATANLAAQSPTLYLANIGSPGDGGWLISDFSYAQSFVTGPSPGGYTLNSVSLVMGGREVNAAGFTLSLFRDSAGTPSQTLDLLSGDSNPGRGLYTYTSHGLALAPSTTYWIVAGANSGAAGYTWNMTWHSSTYAAVGGWSIDTADYCQAYRRYDWTSWGLSTSAEGLMQFSVNATVVPEPASLTLLFLGAVLLGTRKR